MYDSGTILYNSDRSNPRGIYLENAESPTLIQPVLLGVHERGRQRPEEGDLESIQHVGVFVCAKSQEADEAEVNDE